MSDPRGTRLLTSIAEQVDIDERLARMLRSDRRRRARNVALLATTLVLVIAGVAVMSLGREDVVEPPKPSTVTTHLVLPEGAMRLEDTGCKGDGRYDYLTEGAELTLFDPEADAGEELTPLALPPGLVVDRASELGWILDGGVGTACVFSWDDLGIDPERYDGIAIYPVLPISHYSVVQDGATAMVWTVGGRTGGLVVDEIGPLEVMSRDGSADPLAVVSLGGGGAARFNFGTECDRTVVLVGFGGGSMRGLAVDYGEQWSDVSVEYTSYEGCELVSRLIGYTTASGRNDPLEAAHVGPIEVIVFDPDDPSSAAKSVVVDVNWTGEGVGVPDVRHEGAYHQWGWLVHPVVDAKVVIDGVDLGAPDFVTDTELGYRLAIDFDGDEYERALQAGISSGCQVLNRDDYDGLYVSDHRDQMSALHVVLNPGDVVTIGAEGVPDGRAELVMYMTEFGESRTPIPGELGQIAPHVGGYAIAWTAESDLGDPLEAQWTVSCDPG